MSKTKADQKDALRRRLALRMCNGFILVSMHRSEDNSDREVWNCIDPDTSQPCLQEFNGEDTRNAKVVVYKPSDPFTAAEWKKHTKNRGHLEAVGDIEI